MLEVWTSNEFEGHYPVGTAAVVIAESAIDAAEYLTTFLLEAGLPGVHSEQMKRLKLEDGEVVILCDGNY